MEATTGRTSRSAGPACPPQAGPGASRRAALGLAAAALAAPARSAVPGSIDVTGAAPPLELRMRATPDGREVTQDAFRGSVTMLYFGYTSCPDVCPLVLQNAVAAGARMRSAAGRVRVLFATVDPGRDTLPVLTGYANAFGPGVTGLAGDANALERLARRYRIAYSVTRSDDPRLYEVTHSAAVYVFDKALNARLLVASLATASPDLDALAADLDRLAQEPPSWKDWLRRIA